MRHKKKCSILVASTNQGTIQCQCEFNNHIIRSKKKTSYVLCCFGDRKPITKAEYDYYIQQGLESFVKVIHQ